MKGAGFNHIRISFTCQKKKDVDLRMEQYSFLTKYQGKKGTTKRLVYILVGRVNDRQTVSFYDYCSVVRAFLRTSLISWRSFFFNSRRQKNAPLIDRMTG